MTTRRRTPPAPARRSRSDATRLRILEAALQAFSAHGYDGAMTRDIAEAAGIQQPLINYHFGSKEGLWRATVAHLFDELRASLRRDLGQVASLDAPEALAAVLRHLVEFTAARPQLSRLMLKETAAGSERLEWIVTHHLRPSFEAALAMIRAAQQRGVLTGIDPVSVYYLFVGAATSAFVMGPAYQLLTGSDPFTAPRRAAYADAVVRLFLPEHRDTGRRQAAAEIRPRLRTAPAPARMRS